MSPDLNCDVVVVGGGPAGSTVAAKLAQRGIDVVLVERMRVPRRKCCAGGLTAGAAKLLPPSALSVLENEIRGIRVSSVGGRSARWIADGPFMYMESRERLDLALWEEAGRCGARVFDGQEAIRVESAGGGVEVTCAALIVRGRFLVGADGAAGVVGGLFGTRRRHVAVGVALEFEQEEAEEGRDTGMVDLLVGLPGRTYGWVFPRCGVVSVGIEIHGRLKDRESALQQVCQLAGVQGRAALYRGVHPIPTCVDRRARVTLDRVVLVGDAAGLCDPLTGEGVRHALLSAGFAADAVEHAVARGPEALQEYERAVNEAIVPELRSAMLILRLLFRLEPAALFVLQHDARARRAALAVLKGELSYCELLRRVGGIRGFIELIGGAAR